MSVSTPIFETVSASLSAAALASAQSKLLFPSPFEWTYLVPLALHAVIRGLMRGHHQLTGSLKRVTLKNPDKGIDGYRRLG